MVQAERGPRPVSPDRHSCRSKDRAPSYQYTESLSEATFWVEVPPREHISRRASRTVLSNSADLLKVTPLDEPDFWVEIPVPYAVKTAARLSQTHLESSSHAESDANNGVNDVYVMEEGEILEDESLYVAGETEFEDLEEDGDDAVGIPVRRLTDFSVYMLENLALLDIATLLECDLQQQYIGASGLVTCHTDVSEFESDTTSADGEDNEHPPRVQLGRILEFDVHWYKHDSKILDPNMYLRTNFAWYILDFPSPSYQNFFMPYWIKHRLVHLAISQSLEDHELDYCAFSAWLRASKYKDLIGRVLTEEDLKDEDNCSYIAARLSDLLCQHRSLHRVLHKVPLIIFLSGVSQEGRPQSKMRLADKEKDILLHRNLTVATTKVAQIASQAFIQKLHVVDKVADLPAPRATPEEDHITSSMQVHISNPENIKWVKASRVAPNSWEQVCIDNTLYTVGNIVIVEKGADANNIRQCHAASLQAQSATQVANDKWFCKIQYMYQAEPSASSALSGKMFHAQWLQHSSQTLLEESAHPTRLFYVLECDDLPLECIFSHCNTNILGIDEDEHYEDQTHFLSNPMFQVGLTWDAEQSAFLEIPPTKASVALAHCEEYKPCISCGLRAAAQAETIWTTQPGGHSISRLGSVYHLRDFVYFRSADSLDGLYCIAQIHAFEYDPVQCIKSVEVRLYGRYNDVVRRQQHVAQSVTDERRLFRTRNRIFIDPMHLDDKIFVQSASSFNSSDDLEDWLSHSDHFYVDLCTESAAANSLADLQPLCSPPRICNICLDDQLAQLADGRRLLQKYGKVRGLELFAGAGGLSTGFCQSGFVETRWAIEFSPSAAATYRHNHPETTVFNQCSNRLLQHAIDTAHGNHPSALQCLGDDRTLLPSMPKPGEVDFIFGGPPCQGFSKMNHHKKSDDVRNTLVCNMLSYVEFYRPAFFLLENVLGLLTYRLRGRRMGVVKFIIRTLSSLGYQVHFKVLQAGQYGAPQARRRVIFWGAKRSVPLPQFPPPTHFFKRMHLFNLETGDVLNPASRAHPSDIRIRNADYHQWAPHVAVTVNDAIGDLIPFDWVNPYAELPQTENHRKERDARAAAGIVAFSAATPYDAEGTYSGFTDAVEYSTEPLTRYQKWMRRRGQEDVTGHFTSRYPCRVVERVVNVPLRPNANHKDLPRSLVEPRLLKRVNDSGYNTIYGRVDGDGYFATALTTVRPNCKGGRLLHPDQKRVISMRECARAQGFPDDYEFLSTNRRPAQRVADQHRQIGNAVPVPLALALGKELGKVLVDIWSEREARESSVKERSPTL